MLRLPHRKLGQDRNECVMTTAKIILLRPEAVPPSRMSEGSAGYDLYAAEDAVIPAASVSEDGRVDVGRSLVPVGFAIELPDGTVGRIGSRSGLSVRSNIEVGAGWVDSDYRGEVMVEMKNLSSIDYEVNKGDRIAQLIFLRVEQPEIIVTDSLESTARGASGIGSTGI